MTHHTPAIGGLNPQPNLELHRDDELKTLLSALGAAMTEGWSSGDVAPELGRTIQQGLELLEDEWFVGPRWETLLHELADAADDMLDLARDQSNSAAIQLATVLNALTDACEDATGTRPNTVCLTIALDALEDALSELPPGKRPRMRNVVDAALPPEFDGDPRPNDLTDSYLANGRHSSILEARSEAEKVIEWLDK